MRISSTYKKNNNPKNASYTCVPTNNAGDMTAWLNRQTFADLEGLSLAKC